MFLELHTVQICLTSSSSAASVYLFHLLPICVFGRSWCCSVMSLSQQAASDSMTLPKVLRRVISLHALGSERSLSGLLSVIVQAAQNCLGGIQPSSIG